MKINKNGLALIELLAVIVVLAILGGIVVVSYNSIILNSKNKLYKNYEDTLRITAKNYVIEKYTNEDSSLIPNVGSTKIIRLSELKTAKVIEDFKGIKDVNCSNSYVIVSRGNDIKDNLDLTYKACLICKLNNTDTYRTNDTDCINR